MMYWDFPSVGPEDRLQRSPALDASKIRLSPEEAWTKLNQDRSPGGVRLGMFDGRPIYTFTVGGGGRGGRRAGRGGRAAAPRPEFTRTTGLFSRHTPRRCCCELHRRGAVNPPDPPASRKSLRWISGRSVRVAKPASALEIFVSRRTTGLCLGHIRRCGSVHNERIATRRVAGSDPALVVFHPVAGATEVMEQYRDLGVRIGNHHGPARADRRHFPVFAFRQISLPRAHQPVYLMPARSGCT